MILMSCRKDIFLSARSIIYIYMFGAYPVQSLFFLANPFFVLCFVLIGCRRTNVGFFMVLIQLLLIYGNCFCISTDYQ